MIVVPDTNILVSAIFWNGPSARLVAELIRKKHTICSSPELLGELRRVLKRDFDLTESQVEEKIAKIRAFVGLVAPQNRVKIVIQDPDDDKVLECALECGAAFVVSKDKHLLMLKSVRGIGILSPEELLEKL